MVIVIVSVCGDVVLVVVLLLQLARVNHCTADCALFNLEGTIHTDSTEINPMLLNLSVNSSDAVKKIPNFVR